MPDLFVGADTSHFSEFYRDVVRLGVVQRFSLAYTDSNRDKLKKEYLTFGDFNKRFSFDEGAIKSFIALAGEMGVKYDDEGFKVSSGELLQILKGLVARDLWDMNEYYMVVNEGDIVINRALEIISNQKKYNSLLGY